MFSSHHRYINGYPNQPPSVFSSHHRYINGYPNQPPSVFSPHHRYINGYPDRPPVRPNTSLGDNLVGIHAALGIVMSLLHQQRMRGMGDVRAPGQVMETLGGCVMSCDALAVAMHGAGGQECARAGEGG